MTMASLQQQGLSARAMGRALSRSPSTITRDELGLLCSSMRPGADACSAAPDRQAVIDGWRLPYPPARHPLPSAWLGG